MVFQIIFREHYLCNLIGWQRKIGNEEAINVARNLAHFTLEIFLKLDQFFSTCTSCFELKRIHLHTDAHTRSPFFMLPIDGCKVVSILDQRRFDGDRYDHRRWPNAIRDYSKTLNRLPASPRGKDGLISGHERSPCCREKRFAREIPSRWEEQIQDASIAQSHADRSWLIIKHYDEADPFCIVTRVSVS